MNRGKVAVALALLGGLGWGCSSEAPELADALREDDADAEEIAESRGALADEGARREPSTLQSARVTATLPRYDDAPRTPDADDPAIWVPRRGEPLILGTLKDAGLAVYDLAGNTVQVVSPPRRPALASTDPPAPGAQPEAGTGACEDSASGETFGRFNNVDIAYDVELRTGSATSRVDVAVVSDRGCDRLRFYALEAGRPGGPLRDITADDAPRVFPRRFVRSWRLAGPAAAVTEANPLDDQNTAYGLAVARRHGALHVFATQRSRAVVGEVIVEATADGHLTYRPARELRFPETFPLRGARGERVRWTPCREEADEEPQLEGLVYDAEAEMLYAGQEVVGLYAVRLPATAPRVVRVPPRALVEPVKSFGAEYWAVPDGDEYRCEREAPEGAPEGTLHQAGAPGVQGRFIEADLEGLALHEGRRGRTLVASSQGDDTFHAFRVGRGAPRYLGAFRVEGVGETDGHAVSAANLGGPFRGGLLVVQNGKAPAPPSEEPIAGYPYDGATRFELIPWAAVGDALPATRE